MPRSHPASRLTGALIMAVLTFVRAAAAQQIATAPPLGYASGEVSYRLRLHTVTVISSPDTSGTTTQRDSAEVLVRLLFGMNLGLSDSGEPNDLVAIDVDSTVATTSRWPAPGMPALEVALRATPHGLQGDIDVLLGDGLLQEVVSAVGRCLPALPAARASEWRRSLVIRWKTADGTLSWSEARGGSWRARGRGEVTSQGRRVPAFRITGRDSVRVMSEGPSGSGTAATDAMLDTAGVLLSSDCTERDTLRFKWGDRRVVQAVERSAVLTLMSIRSPRPNPVPSQAPAAPPAQDSPFADLHRPAALPGLRGFLAGGRVPELRTTVNLDADCHASFATSYLAASGAAPAKPVPPFSGNDTAGAHAVWRDRFMRWACQYAPEKAFDGDTSTAWVEGVAGDGVGEALVVPVGEIRTGARIDPRGPVEIWAGFGRSPALHRANARPREIRVYLLLAQEVASGEGTVESATTYRNLAVVGVRQVVLEDRDGYQPLPLPPIPAGEHFLLGIEVLSVYPGTRWQDTAITEVRGVR